MIEDAWDVACRANVRHGRRFEPHLPVRYRQDVHALFAEIQVRTRWFLACTRAASSVASCDTNYKAYLPTPRLFKLHGDLSERGIREFVSSHADYRRLMVCSLACVYRHMLSVHFWGCAVVWRQLRDVGCTSFLRYLATNFSFLFYGHSLEDKDLLATLDNLAEIYGTEVAASTNVAWY